VFDLPVELPLGKRQALATAIDALKGVMNVSALALGGSYARGFGREGSDVDIGIYYREAAPLQVFQVRDVAESICSPGSEPVVTELYGWGPWVNGGAWIQTPATKVDFVYRNIDQVCRVIEEGRRGAWRHDYDQQPPHGFRSVVYFAETHCCVPLHDPDGEIRRLKEAVAEYPAPLKARIVAESLWGAEFALWSCHGFVAADDVCNAVGCMTRVSHYLVHAIFALNEEYFLNDKHTERTLHLLPKVPYRYTARVADVLARPGRNRNELSTSLAALRQIWTETVALADGAYRPRFDLEAAVSADPGPTSS
jgi:hypothetical protein